MSTAGLCLREQECGYTCHRYYVVLGVDEVGRLTYTVSEALGAHGLVLPFLFPSRALDVDSSDARLASARYSSVLCIVRFVPT